jgi:2',3'-cyclic-nucleotide 2'-phosphodiesterase (5'-nucleotidase family)
MKVPLSAAFFTFLLFAVPAGCEEPGITLYYTASLNGNLQGCTCTLHPRAGLSKRAVFMNRLNDRGNAIVVEAGNILSFDRDPDLAAAILDEYKTEGYDAIGVGNSEFSDGIDALMKYRDGFPLISNNLTICKDAKSCVIFSPEPVVRQKGRYKVGIFALLDPKYFNYPFDDVMDAAKLLPPEDRARLFTSRLRDQKADLTICLFYGLKESALRVIKNAPGLDVLVLGGENKLIEGEKSGDTLIVSPGEEGNRIGILEITFAKTGKSYKNSFKYFTKDDPDLPSVKKKIDDYNDKLKSRLLMDNND